MLDYGCPVNEAGDRRVRRFSMLDPRSSEPEAHAPLAQMLDAPNPKPGTQISNPHFHSNIMSSTRKCNTLRMDLVILEYGTSLKFVIIQEYFYIDSHFAIINSKLENR